MQDFLIFIGVLVVVLFILRCNIAAYDCGCVDGYGYSREPTCPGYRKAGEYLRKYCADRWPELRA